MQAIVNELGGERIDIVPWSPDPERFAKLALAPARVAKVFSIPESRTIQAIVDEDQLSLAIGRNGQNVRLASELTGWKIDLYSSREWLERGGEGPLFAPLPSETEDEQVTQIALKELQGLPGDLVGVLEAGGIVELSDLLDLDADELHHIPDLTTEQLEILQAFIADLTEDSTAVQASAEAEPADPEGVDAEAEAPTGEAEAPAEGRADA